MTSPCSVQIRITAAPFPDTEQPDFVNDAYCGLTLTTVLYCSPGEDEKYPHGAYLVPVTHLLRKMAAEDTRAYRYLAAEWEEIEKNVADDECRLLLPFPQEYCEVVK